MGIREVVRNAARGCDTMPQPSFPSCRVARPRIPPRCFRHVEKRAARQPGCRKTLYAVAATTIVDAKSRCPHAADSGWSELCPPPHGHNDDVVLQAQMRPSQYSSKHPHTPRSDHVAYHIMMNMSSHMRHATREHIGVKGVMLRVSPSARYSMGCTATK